jgi:hypothetical protein
MRYLTQKWRCVVVSALALVSLASLSAAPTTATFDLNSAGSGASLAGVYTSPYTASINGGPTVDVICDDFSDESYIPEQWTANVTQLSTVTSNSPTYLQWSGPTTANFTVEGTTYSWSLNQAQAYTVAAVLATEILTSATGSTTQKDLSYALWELFDPIGTGGAFNSSDPGVVPWLEGTTSQQTTPYLSDLSAASQDIVNAMTTVTSDGLTPASFPNVTIYSFDRSAGAPTCGGSPCPSAPPQEFITVSMAEPPSPAVFAVYVVVGGGLLLFWRRRILRADNQASNNFQSR